jgi:hypothetical protein
VQAAENAKEVYELGRLKVSLISAEYKKGTYA